MRRAQWRNILQSLNHERSTPVIRKLKSGGYRLYSRKINPKTGRRRNLGTFKDPSGGREARTRSAIFQAPLSVRSQAMLTAETQQAAAPAVHD